MTKHSASTHHPTKSINRKVPLGRGRLRRLAQGHHASARPLHQLRQLLEVNMGLGCGVCGSPRFLFMISTHIYLTYIHSEEDGGGGRGGGQAVEQRQMVGNGHRLGGVGVVGNSSPGAPSAQRNGGGGGSGSSGLPLNAPAPAASGPALV